MSPRAYVTIRGEKADEEYVFTDAQPQFREHPDGSAVLTIRVPPDTPYTITTTRTDHMEEYR